MLRANVAGPHGQKLFGYAGIGAAVGTEGQNNDYHWGDVSTPDAMGNVATQQRVGTPHDFTTTNRYDAGGRLVRATTVKNLTNTDTTANALDSDGGIYFVQTKIDLGADPLHGGSHWFGVDSTSNLYGEDGRLRYSWAKRDTLYGDPSITSAHRYSQLEEYRYDALGRRIWTRNLRGSQCGILAPDTYCVMAITRTVWDGSQILYEIRTNGDSAQASKDNWESDTPGLDPNGQFGRVGYTHGGGIDHPLSLLRIAYLGGDVTMLLHADYRGELDGGTCFQAGATINCPGQFPVPGLSVAYDAPPPATIYAIPPPWIGNLVTANQDQSGYLYMRNRYYDPKSGRFTQADPIGLAGGLNVYGFAEGDPVSYADPYGLATYVNCRPAFVGRGKDASIAHCAVRVIDNKRRIDTTIELIMVGGKNKIFKNESSSDAMKNYDKDAWVAVGVPKGMTISQFDDKVLSSANSESASREGHPYSPDGSFNSNRFVYNIITKAGGRVPGAAAAGFWKAPGLCGGTGSDTGKDCSP